MEKIVVINNSVARLYKLRGNGQCTCDECKNRCWTDWFYEYNGKVLCDTCLKRAMEEDMVLLHNESSQNKEFYTELHLKVLQLQKEERQTIKEILKTQNDELLIQDAYNTMSIKRGW